MHFMAYVHPSKAAVIAAFIAVLAVLAVIAAIIAADIAADIAAALGGLTFLGDLCTNSTITTSIT